MMKTNYLMIAFLFFAALLVGCSSGAKVGALQSESQSVELGNGDSVNVNINMGAGNLTVTGGAEKLMQADFNYNVAELKPEVKYTDGTLLLQQPEVNGLPVLQGITDFRNEWDLQLNNDVPMNLRVNMGAGNSDLQVTSLSLTGLDLTLGAGKSTVDLDNDWIRDLDVSIDAGATDLKVRLPRNVGVRVEVDEGPHSVETMAMKQDGNIYTNEAYGKSQVTLQINIKAGIGLLNLEVADN